jgi:hypothetical protein
VRLTDERIKELKETSVYNLPEDLHNAIDTLEHIQAQHNKAIELLHKMVEMLNQLGYCPETYDLKGSCKGKRLPDKPCDKCWKQAIDKEIGE